VLAIPDLQGPTFLRGFSPRQLDAIAQQYKLDTIQICSSRRRVLWPKSSVNLKEATAFFLPVATASHHAQDCALQVRGFADAASVLAVLHS
jgi:hypothetical protein